MNEGTKNALHEAEAVSDSFANVSCHPDPYDGSRPATPDSFQQNFGYGEPEYDFDCDSDMSDSASLSPSYHSAGQGSARHYRAQLKRNEITALDFFADDYFRLGKFAFPPEALTPQVSLSRDGSRCGCFELNSLPDLLS
jgi:hypothetical protein